MRVLRLVDGERRQRRAREALDGWVTGPDAPVEATASALVRAESAGVVVLVEGISDQIALETLAERHGRDLGAERIVIVPIGGAQAVTRYLVRFGPEGAGLVVVGLCDAGEELYFRRALATGGFGTSETRIEMERLGFFVCEEDLEDELIRASDRAAIEGLLDSQADLDSFQTLQNQPAWREKGFEAQIRRWLGAGARRKARYARLLVLSLPLDRMPRPLTAVLAATTTPIELSRAELREVTGYAAMCARPALAIFERERPDDRRPRAAIDAAQAFADGAERTKALRDSAWAAYRAAREARDAGQKAAGAAARAAGDAVGAAFLHPLAKATQVKHILGSAAHAARAFELSAGDDPSVGADHIAHSRIGANLVVVDALRRYPIAPPGGGRVGELIRQLDASLR